MQEKEQGIGEFVIDAYAIYGKAVNTDRHVAGMYDGLKPVYKRTFLAALDEAGSRKVKTATVVGRTIGHYHPHGDAAVVPVVTELVRAGLLNGQGSFGYKSMFAGQDLPAAASRYTEVLVNPKWKECVGKLLPYSPNMLNDLGNLESCYLPLPAPLCLSMGSFGIALGLTVNYPAFTYSSMVKAGLAGITNKPEPWKLLVPNYGLSMSDEDKETFWNNSSGSLTYNFKITPGFSGGLSGWYIEGDPSFVKPKWRELLKAKHEDGKVLIRDESAKKDHKVFIARTKRTKSITDSDVEEMVYRAASVKKYFSLYTVFEGQTRPITGGTWIQMTMWNYDSIVKKYKTDQINKIDIELEVLDNLKEIAKLLSTTEKSWSTIQKELKLSDGAIDKAKGMTLNALRNTDTSKKKKDLKDKRDYFVNLKTVDMLKDFV